MDNKIGLTITQKQIYDFIIAFHKEEGVYPTVREICKGRIDDWTKYRCASHFVALQKMSSDSLMRHMT